MPYIPEERRKALKSYDRPRSTGELNWLITDILIDYVKREGIRYATLSATRAVLHDIYDEFGRRVMDPYEDQMRTKNGEVFQVLLDLLAKQFKN